MNALDKLEQDWTGIESPEFDEAHKYILKLISDDVQRDENKDSE